jgi:hypothetical protein
MYGLTPLSFSALYNLSPIAPCLGIIIQDAYNFVGADIAGMVYGSAEAPGEIAANAGLMQAAEALGEKLVPGKQS